jgi:ligand-binding sensor domain-containing protein
MTASVYIRIQLILLFLGSLELHGQNSSVPGGFKRVLIQEGLPSSEVYDLYEDSKGYLWIATDAGICRYNGLSLTTFTTRNGLPDNTVFHIREDSKGRIWVQTFSGAVGYCENDRFHSIPANDSLIKLYGNGQKTIYTFFVDENDCVIVGGLYIGGCYRILPNDGYKALQHVASPFTGTSTRELWTDKKNHLYACGIGVFQPPTFARISHNGHLTSIPIDYNVSVGINMRTLLTSRNTILFSLKNIVYEIEPDGNVKRFEFPGTIIGLDETRGGDVWVNQLLHGTTRFAGGDLSIQGTTYLDGYSISCVVQDAEQGLWFATVGKGMLFLAGLEFGYMTTSEGLIDYQISGMSILSNSSVLLGHNFSTVSLMTINKNGTISQSVKSIGKFSEIAVEVATRFHGQIIANSDQTYGLNQNMEMNGEVYNKRHIKGYAIHPSGDTLFGFSHSYFVWLDSSIKEVKYSLAPLRIISACYSGDDLYLGGMNGLWILRDTFPEYLGQKYPGLNTRIDDMVADRNGCLWIATRGDGVFVLDHGRTHHYVTDDGLSSNTCRSIAADSKGNIWVGTNKGVSVISNFNGLTGNATISRYTTANGLLSNEVTMLEMKDDVLWTAGPEGLCWVPANRLLVNMTAPPIYITKIISGTDTLTGKDSIELEYVNNRLAISYEGISLPNAATLRYRYRISDSQRDWITTDSRELSLTNIDPGRYTLTIYALNANGIPSKQPAVLYFNVKTPFYRTYWFYALILVSLFTVILIAVRSRINVVRRKTAERSAAERRMLELRLSALRAQMNPHFIFNAINSIQHYVLNNDSEKAYTYLARFSKLIRLVLEQSQSNTISLKQEVELLQLYMELEQLRFSKPVTVKMQIDPDLDRSGLRIPGMLLQPYVENAFWHGLQPLTDRSPELVISIRKVKGSLVITITDNGIGRKEAAKLASTTKGRSYGMVITKERLRLTGKAGPLIDIITVEDVLDTDGNICGTKVEITLSISNLQDE